MAIEILGCASTRAVARTFLQTCNIADYDAETQTMVPREGVSLHPFRATETITVMKPTGNMVEDQFGNMVPEMAERPGFHFNLRIYGDLEETLRAGAPGGGDPENPKLWNYSKLKTYIDNKLGTVAEAKNKELTGARLPGGYQWAIGPNWVRLYDAGEVQQRSNVWA